MVLGVVNISGHNVWFWVSCALGLCLVGLFVYLCMYRKRAYVRVDDTVLPLTTNDCGGAEHTLIYASQEEIKMLENTFRGGREGSPFVLPDGTKTKVKCYARFIHEQRKRERKQKEQEENKRLRMAWRVDNNRLDERIQELNLPDDYGGSKRQQIAFFHEHRQDSRQSGYSTSNVLSSMVSFSA